MAPGDLRPLAQKEDELGPQQAVDRAGGPGRGQRRIEQHHRGHAAGDAGDQIEQQEGAAPVDVLAGPAEEEQAQGVDRQVHRPDVQKAGRDQPPDLPGTDQRVGLGAEALEHHGQGGAAQGIHQQPGAEVGQQQAHGDHRRAHHAAGEEGLPLPLGQRRGAPGELAADLLVRQGLERGGHARDLRPAGHEPVPPGAGQRDHLAAVQVHQDDPGPQVRQQPEAARGAQRLQQLRRAAPLVDQHQQSQLGRQLGLAGDAGQGGHLLVQLRNIQPVGRLHGHDHAVLVNQIGELRRAPQHQIEVLLQLADVGVA